MTVTMNTATKEPLPNQFGAMNPVYGAPNTIPTICMSLYPTNVNYSVKKPIEIAKATKNTSQLRKLIPIICGLLTFATVLSILIIFMDTSEIRLQKFRLNMTRDEELNIQRDNPELVAYIRWQLSQRKSVPPVPSYSKRNALVPELAMEIARHVDLKDRGYFVQSLTNFNGEFLTGPWLAEHLNWGGLIIEPDAHKFFSLCKETLMQPKVQIIQACVSPNNHPREIVLREEDSDSSEVQIASLVSGNQSWFFPRAKCYPLYSLMLAVNRTEIDVLSLGCQSQEIEILRTVPFDKVKIRVITIHFNGYYEGDYPAYDSEFATKLIDLTTKFLQSKSYRLEKIIDQNYIYTLVDGKNGIIKESMTGAVKPANIYAKRMNM